MIDHILSWTALIPGAYSKFNSPLTSAVPVSEVD